MIFMVTTAMLWTSHIPSYRIFGAPYKGMLRPSSSYKTLTGRIRKLAEPLALCSTIELKNGAGELRSRIAGGAAVTSKEIVCTSFAYTLEAVRRTTGLTYYDTQLAGGLALAAGVVAEIQTGEGKTIISGLPAALYGMKGAGAHVATTSDYLSSRDYEELAPAFKLLGLTAGAIAPQMPDREKQAAYACDITYGPGYEFGFDFLRDQIALRANETGPLGSDLLERLRGRSLSQQPLLQRGHGFALIDEADSVLIDEASTPLILSGQSAGDSCDPQLYHFARTVAGELEIDVDFKVAAAASQIEVTSAGAARIGEAFERKPDGMLSRPWPLMVENALRAGHLLERNVDFVVEDDAVKIIDPHTGRIHDERTWRGGLHQAVEVAQGLDPGPERMTQARITRQRYTKFYSRVSGLTGTAVGGEHDFYNFYRLPVVKIPRNRECRRNMLPTRFFATLEAKRQAVARDTAQRRSQGQPVLIGAPHIRESLELSRALQAHGVEHQVLNGVQDAVEAAIIAAAGAAGTVTIATNMAGRGTDIRLDDKARAAGGLHVCATSFHASRRIDRQLTGRSARQGDPGSAQFMASAGDDLIIERAPELAELIARTGKADGECRQSHAARIEWLQSRLEHESLCDRHRMAASDSWFESVQSSLARPA